MNQLHPESIYALSYLHILYPAHGPLLKGPLIKNVKSLWKMVNLQPHSTKL